MASLFQGSPQTATSYTTSTSETPKWMQDAIYNQIQVAQGIANAPYQPYSMPTVAPLTSLQEDAYSAAAEAAKQGAWKSALGVAQSGMQGLANAPGGVQAAQPYYNQQAGTLGGINYQKPSDVLGQYTQQAVGLSGISAANPYIQQGLAQSGISAASPYLNASSAMLGGLDYGSIERGIAPYVQEAVNTNAYSAAMPFMAKSAQSSVSDIGSYMNPYTQNVTDQIAKLGARNLSENLLPGVSDAFVRAGQFGGSRMGEFGSRALRDTQEAILSQQGSALQQGYGQALNAAQADQARLAQLAGTAGSLTGAQQQALISGGQAIGSARQAATQQALSGAGQFANIGQQLAGMTQAQQNAYLQAAQQSGALTQAQQQALLTAGQGLSQAQQQAIAAQQAGASQYGQMGTNLAQITGADLSRRQGALGQVAQLAQSGQQMTAADIAMLEAAGRSQQGQMQAELTAAQQQWQNEQLYPKQQMDWLSTQIRGMAPITPTTQTQSGTTTGATYSASPLSQLATGLAAGAGVYNLTK